LPKRLKVENRSKRALDENVYLGRQPIYGPKRDIRAYELLYRRAPGDTSARVTDADGASADVVLKAFLEIGLPAISPEQPVFINHTKALLMVDPILPADRCVVEVLETVAVDAETMEAVRHLKSLGYRIALDDFAMDGGLAPLLPLADFVKLDYRALGDVRFRDHVHRLRPCGVRLIAEKIESEAELRWCRKLGCELFQGYYLRKPEVVAGRRIPSNRLSVLSLLAECANTENSASVIASLISRDAPLTYGLLRLANSAMYRRRSEIRTPAQAVTLLGMDFVFRWATLLALAGNDDCPTGYLESALQRARMSELIAPLHNCCPAEAYITGLLSTLDAVLNAPIGDLVQPLPIDIRYKRALLEREGALGVVLDSVVAYEGGNCCQVENAAAMQRSFWDAAQYSQSMIRQMLSTARVAS
jgi:c-di-GMP phosphodiesterase